MNVGVFLLIEPFASVEEQLKRARQDLSSTGRKVWIYPFDMNRTDEIDSWYSKIVDDTGIIDILVNNAGGTRRGPMETMTDEDWHFVINLNLTSVFMMCRTFGRACIK